MSRSRAPREAWRETYLNTGTMVFWIFHLVAIAGVIWLGFSWTGVILALSFYFARMFFLTAGFHRYFSHRSYKTSRWFQTGLAFCGQACLQRGVLWWAAARRSHHRHSDQPDDSHSPRQDGFWWSHVGWSASKLWGDGDYDRFSDVPKYPEV